MPGCILDQFVIIHRRGRPAFEQHSDLSNPDVLFLDIGPQGHVDSGDETATPRVSFLDLSNEQLVKIIEELDLPDLYNLSHVCRRFNLLAMPRYLRRHQIHYPQKFVRLRPQDLHLLPALLTSVAFTATNSLQCIFDRRDFAANLIRLHRLALKLTFIREATIDFWPVLNSDFLAKDWDMTAPLAQVFQGLFEAILSRQCESLTVRCGMSERTPLPPSPPTPPKRWLRWPAIIRHFLPPTFCGGAKFKSSDVDADRPVNGSPRLKRDSLTTLDISSTMMLIPPMLDWTIDLIVSSPITHLNFDSVRISAQRWAQVLPAITLPSLEHLSLINYDSGETVSFASFIDFLKRHPTIRILRCAGLPPPPETDKNEERPLPRLEDIEGPASYIVYFLESPYPPCYIHRVAVTHVPEDAFDGVELNRLLIATNRLSHEFKLSLSPPEASESDICLWLTSGLSEGQFLDSNSGSMLPRMGKLELNIAIQEGESTLKMRRILPFWVALFSALWSLSFDSCMLPPATEKVAWIDFVRAVSDQCPTLLSIKLGSIQHLVYHWLEKDVLGISSSESQSSTAF